MVARQRERILLIAAALCIVAVAGDRFVVSPLVDAWSARAERITTLQQSLTNGEQLLKRESIFETQWREMLGRSLPSDTAMAEAKVQRAVQEWALTSRLRLTTQKLRWVEETGEYKLLELQATSEGDLAAITRFLYEMETDANVAVRFEDVALVARDQGGRQLSMSVEFTGLALKEEE
jgi:hypothetical protein